MGTRSLPMRRTGWLLLVLVLLVRAMLPQGFMPVVSSEGIRVALCTGNGPTFVVLGRDGTLHPEEPEQKSTPCPYALATAAADLPPPLVLPAPPEALPCLGMPALAFASLTPWRALRPPARGPPAIV